MTTQNSPIRATPGDFGIKFARHTPPHRTCGIKLALLARNGPFWQVSCVQGELCTAYKVDAEPVGHNRTPSAAGVEGAGVSGGPGRGAGGWRQGQGGPRDRPLRAQLACGDLAGGPPPTGTHSGQALRAGQDAWAAAHGAARPSRHPGTPKGRVPQYPPLTQPLPRRGSGRMTVSPGDGDASTGTCRQRRPLPGQPRQSDRRSPCAQDAEPHRYSDRWPEPRARRNRSSRR